MLQPDNSVAVVILAAGKGTRMKSAKAKVLHELQGAPMVNYVVDSAKRVAGVNVVVVIGHQADTVHKVVSNAHDDVQFALQEEQLGTGHAVKCAIPHVPLNVKDVVILCGDVPLITPRAIRHLIEAHNRAGRDLTVLAVNLDDPKGYGRIIVNDQNRVVRIIEEADATPEQKKIRIVNSGVYCVTRLFLEVALDKIESNNVQGEFYLTDIMEIGHGLRKNVGALVWDDSREVMGVNTIKELELAETIMKRRSVETS